MSTSTHEIGDAVRLNPDGPHPRPLPQTDRAIHALKGIAIIGVVFHHVQNRRFCDEMNANIAILPIAFTWCVLLFFAISGWLHGLTEERRSKTIGAFLLNRAKRLLVPFFALVLLYASIWQVIQIVGISDIGARLARSFGTKVAQSLPGCDYNPVAEQLYFLPLLFVVASAIHVSFRIFGAGGVWCCAAVVLFAGMILLPGAGNTGPSSGVILFGCFCYASGFLMYLYRFFRYRIFVVLSVALLVFFVMGVEGLSKVVPLLMIECMHQMRISRITSLCMIGEASGTIYAYHAPFILAPLVILVAWLPKVFQFAGVLAAGFVSIVACTVLFFAIRNSRLKWTLL